MSIQLPQLFNTILQKIEKLHRDFKSFKQEAEEKSELCRYIGQWLKIVALLKNASAADREGNWNLIYQLLKTLCQCLQSQIVAAICVMVLGTVNV